MEAAARALEANNDGMCGGEAFDTVLRAAVVGAEWAWRLIVEHYSGALLGYLRVRAPDDPEDAFSETWMSAASAIASFDGDEPAFRSWLFVIAHRRAIDAARRRSRQPPVVDSEDARVDEQSQTSTEDEVLEALSTENAVRLLSELTSDQQDVLTLRVIAGFSLQETARIVNKNVGAVKALQRRGLATLRRLLEAVPVSKHDR